MKTTPFQAFPLRGRSKSLPFALKKHRQTSAVTERDVTKTLRTKKRDPMAIASPKTKEELVRQFRFNPEVNTRLEAFMKAEPGLVQFVKELPREQLERKFLLRKMQEHERKRGYDTKVKAWLEKPEQAELVQSLKATISPEMKSERQAQVLVSQAKNYIRNSGLRIS